MNGSTIKSALTLAAVSGYVQQDDLFIGTLTVREHLKVQVVQFYSLFEKPWPLSILSI